MTQQLSSSVGSNGTAPEISTQAKPDAPPVVDVTYCTILLKQLEDTYRHMGQYLADEGFLAVQSAVETPLLEPVLPSERSSKGALQADFEAVHNLLTDMTRSSKIAAKTCFMMGLFFLPFSATIWFATPLSSYFNEHGTMDGVLPFIVYISAFIVWGLPYFLIQDAIWQVLVRIWIRWCRSILHSLEMKLDKGDLAPADMEKLRARTWKIAGSQVRLVPSGSDDTNAARV